MLNKYALKIYYDALKETLYIIGISSIFILIIGLIIGFIMFVTEPENLFSNKNPLKFINFIISTINDIFRSIPFMILLIMLIPITRFLVGTMLGPKGAIPALVISASPFFARVVYNSLKEVPKETIETLDSMGASILVKVKVIFKEALSSLILGVTLTLVTLVGFMSAAAVIGAGGLAFVPFEYGKFGTNYPLMYLSVATILLIVLIIQLLGNYISKKFDYTIKNKEIKKWKKYY